jgi:6-pyruvoyltetrahydropterin/6-carboxytetrahydropterin synthase
MPYRVTKTYPHSLGLSACFRQWRADSHCRYLHGYALSFTLTFEALALDARNWVLDFGSLKPVKEFLVDTFDHKLLVAEDDPMLTVILSEIHGGKIADVVTVPAVGCEAFAEQVAIFVDGTFRAIIGVPSKQEVRLISVECREHEGNAGVWFA